MNKDQELENLKNIYALRIDPSGEMARLRKELSEAKATIKKLEVDNSKLLIRNTRFENARNAPPPKDTKKELVEGLQKKLAHTHKKLREAERDILEKDDRINVLEEQYRHLTTEMEKLKPKIPAGRKGPFKIRRSKRR